MPSAFRWAVALSIGFAALAAGAGDASTSSGRVLILVQSSPLAGSQYHALAEVAPRIRVGDELELRREPDNRHDANAVLVLWRGYKLGYLPRRENRSVARALDEGQALRATVSRLRPEETDPWKRLEIAVQVEL